ncbi:MAG: RsiV family protein [Treponema sp.]|jgi:hypothetical protein|nr:RsiV family protein [Treponema sp.]
MNRRPARRKFPFPGPALTLFPLIAALGAACAGTAPAEKSPAALPAGNLFTPYVKNETIPGERHAAKLSFTLIDLSPPGPGRRLVRKLLNRGRSPEDYARRLTAEWKRAFDAVERDNRGANWVYEEAQNVFLAGNYGVLKKNVSEYRGGAHPLWREDSYVVDLVNARRLGLRDVISAGGFSRFQALAGRELRRFSQTRTGSPLPPGTPLSRGIYLEDDIPLEDYYPDKNGLNLQWDPYEIAPYSVGGVEINLAWTELAGILSVQGKSLAAAFHR